MSVETMAARAARTLSREERELIEEAIAHGDFRDLEDFETFALRRAVAQLRLKKLQAMAGKQKHTPEQILKQARAVRRAVAKRHGT
jgi:hypothetical protein